MVVSQHKNFQVKVTDSQAGLRLDQVAHLCWPEYSRGRLQTWIKDGHLKLNGEIATPKTKVKGGALLSLDVVLESQGQWQAQEIPLSICYEDEHLLVIDKPANLVVHPAPGHPDNTLVNALIHHHPKLLQLPRAGIIHRIDKDTTGLLVVAKTLLAHTQLVAMMQEREIKRQYLALVWGCVTGSATVDKPIGRHPRHRTRMAVTQAGKPSVTHYRIEKRFEHHTLLRVSLETGRTHQIRVHLAHVGYPIVGDQLYAGRQRNLLGGSDLVRAEFAAFKRQALHAAVLEFEHPMSNEVVEIEAALPDDFEAIMRLLP